MRAAYTIAVCLALLPVSAFGQTDDGRGITGTAEASSAPEPQNWAVVIGVGAYDDPALTPLPNAVRDAKAVSAALTRAESGFAPRNVILMTEDAANRLHRPTRSNILAILGQWVSLAGPKDSLLVYFAGHGVEDAGRLVLMPLDGRVADVANTGVPYGLFEEKLDRSAAKRALVILDACHSGTGRGDSIMTRGMMSDIERHSEGRITLAACKEDERSHEYGDVQHGAFTWFLLEGLSGRADANGDAYVSALELSNYTFEETRRWAAAKGLSQTPRLISDISGDIVLAKVTVVTSDKPHRPPTVVAPSPGEPRAGDARTFAGIEMVWVPAGSFDMGSPTGEQSRIGDEAQHRVALTKGFWLGKYEVTQAQWQAVRRRNPSHSKGGNLPVERVSWSDCQEFVRKLNAKGQGAFRLPTEAEWEYACRAGAQTRYCFGDSDNGLDDYAWYIGNSDSKTHEVGTKRANGWGLYDMHGNVWEWCQDWYGDYPSGSVTNPMGSNRDSFRVARGGGWIYDPRHCRSANRLGRDPDSRLSSLGFRLARDADR